MGTTAFEAKVRQSADHAVIDLIGQVDREAEARLNAAFDEATARGSHTVLLNFTAVDYINSTGIAVIVGVLARARRDGRQLSVCGLTDHYRTIFEITRLVDFMQVYPDEQSAVSGGHGVVV